MTRDAILSVDGDYAEVVLLPHNPCHFLTGKKLCRIHEAYREFFIRDLGHFSPQYQPVNGRLEMALQLFCPHAARLALLDLIPMRFSFADIKGKSDLCDN